MFCIFQFLAVGVVWTMDSGKFVIVYQNHITKYSSKTACLSMLFQSEPHSYRCPFISLHHANISIFPIQLIIIIRHNSITTIEMCMHHYAMHIVHIANTTNQYQLKTFRKYFRSHPFNYTQPNTNRSIFD